MRLGDLDALFRAIKNSDWLPHERIEAMEMVREQPTIDAVPVTRCRDCKYWHESTGYCEKHSYFIGADGMSCSPAESPSWTMWDTDDFCSYGERKEGDS